MKDRTKEIIKDGFGSLVNNASAIRGAKAGPFWLTLVMFILSVLLPVIPLFVSQVTTQGSSFLSRYSYGLERYVTSIAMDLKDNRLAEFSIDEQHMLTISENGNNVDFTGYTHENAYASYLDKNTDQYNFMVYVSDATTDKEKSDVNKLIATTYYANGTTNVSADSENVYRPSYMILFKNGVYVAIYGSNTTKALAYSYSADYKTFKAGNDYLTQLLTVKDKEGNEVAKSIVNDDYVNGVYKNFKKFLDKSYETLKIKNTWITSAIYLGIFFGLSVIMGFLMWLLTRGKNNPNNYYTPWLTMKIQARLGLAPALITLIVGFFLTSYAPMIFIMAIGLRVMWVSMKELRPIQQQLVSIITTT